jgi:hypothetical protein
MNQPALKKREARLEGRGAAAVAFPSTVLGTGETSRSAGFLRHTA